jgi:predicted dehydrogenase
MRARVIQDSSLSRVGIVADLDAVRARTLAGSVGCRSTTDWYAAATSPKIDLVIVSTPTKFHGEAAIAALRAGKHVLCEKPLARSLAEANEIAATAHARARVLKTGFNYRYMAHVRKAKELIAAGAVGPLQFLRCRYGHGGRPGYEQHWCTDQEVSGGGVLIEQGIHVLDLVRYLFGEPAQVLAQTSRLFWDFPQAEDNCFLLLQTRSAQTAQIHVSWTQWMNLFSLEIFGRDGYLHLTGRDRYYGPQQLVWGKRQPGHGRPQEEIFEFPPPDDSWSREWEEFLSAISAQREPMSAPADSLRTLQLVEAAYESSRRQAWIEVSQVNDPVGIA